MDISAFLTTFGVIFLAELGDKTQLTAIALAARYPWKKAFLGIALAFTVLNAAAVVVGKVVFELVPLGWIQAASALLFLVFGVLTLKGDGEEEDEDGAEKRKARGPVLTAFVLILFAELGDKTQLMTASLAAQHGSPLGVFAGSTLALWLVSLLGLLVGAQLARVVPMKWVHRAAGVAFLLFALYAGWSAAKTFGLVGGAA